MWSFSDEGGKKLTEVAALSAPPVYDGLIAAREKLYVSLNDGRVVCFGAKDVE